MDEASAVDAGFDAAVLAQMMRTMSRFDDDEIPLAGDDVLAAREYFRRWVSDIASVR